MAENADTKPSKTRFLSKSKWGKVFKENEATATASAGNSAAFSLNDDVIDFLKPSREAAAERLASVRPQLAPKLDIAIAQRWPSTHEVRLANSADQTTPVSRPLYEKPTRRPGLTVGFAKTAPEIIGEGGEESDEPTSEISRRKILVSRSVSERRSTAFDQTFGVHQSTVPGRSIPISSNDVSSAGQLRRANTSYKELSHPLERKHASPPLPNSHLPHTINGRIMDNGPDPSLQRREEGRQPVPGGTRDANNLNVTAPTDEEFASTARRQRIMRANEGMAFRRASALILNDEDVTPQEPASMAYPEEHLGVPTASLTARSHNDASTRPMDSDDLHPGYAPSNVNTRLPMIGHLPTKAPTATGSSNHYPEPQIPSSAPSSAPYDRQQQVLDNSSRNRAYESKHRDAYSRGDTVRQDTYQQATQDTSPAAVPPPNVQQSFDHPPHPRNQIPRPEPSFVAPVAPNAAINTTSNSKHAVTNSSSISNGASYSQSPTSPAKNNSDHNAKAALQDFAGRVKHMKGVFKLTSDKEKAADVCQWPEWLQSGLWWYLNAKLGLEAQLSLRSQYDGPRQQLLTQAHVDLAKALWISDEQLSQHLASPHSSSPRDHRLEHESTALRNALEYLALQMAVNNIMPPHQSLIQGQDIRIWLHYPSFTATIGALLSGDQGGTSSNSRDDIPDPLNILPIGDSAKRFCFGRFMVDVVLNTNERETDRVPLPSICSILRGKNDYQISIAITSQNGAVRLFIEENKTRHTSYQWKDVSWKASTSSIIVHLPKGYDAVIRMREQDFTRLSNTFEHAQVIDNRIRPQQGETPLHNAHLLELQYTDGSGGKTFPTGKLHNCRALVYEQKIQDGLRKFHAGVRLVLVTEADHKSVVSVEHQICRTAPLFYEFLTDAAANGTTAMVIRFRDENQSCRALLVFPDMGSRQAFHDSLNAMHVTANETIIGRSQLTSLDITSSFVVGSSVPTHSALKDIQWQKLGVTNSVEDDGYAQSVETVCSENLRVIIRHASGTFTDRMNLGKGELLIRLPCGGSTDIQVYREPQQDFSMTVDTRNTPPEVADGVWRLLREIQQKPTVRSFNFASADDLHVFQACITGYTVLFDGNAASFGISRRMMVVPIYHKWQASNVRIQVVAHSSVFKVLAFMDDFSHADAMCIQVKSMDVFESGKGDGKGKKWTVKMVDAKFSLPKQEKTEGQSDGIDEDQAQRRFVNLEGLDYAEEHDDITIGFETQSERDAFAKALPAATTVSRMITLKRRI